MGASWPRPPRATGTPPRVVLEEPGISGASGELITVVLGENADKSLRVDVVRASR